MSLSTSKNKLRLAILMGGHYLDHELAILSGISIIESLMLMDKYELIPVKITREGNWQFPKDYKNFWKQKKKLEFVELNAADALLKLKRETDVVWVGPMSDYAEDGTLSGWLEMAGIPYTGGNITASALACDKVISSQLFQAEGLNVPPFIYFTAREWMEDPDGIVASFKKIFDFPVIVKPRDRGGSNGIAMANDFSELDGAVNKALEASNQVVIQKFIKGTEVWGYVLDRGSERGVMPLTPLKVTYPGSQFLTKDLKLSPKMNIEAIDALSGLPRDKIQEAVLKTHTSLECNGISRADMIIDNNDKIFVLETTCIPGLFSDGPVMKALKPVLDISFNDLIDILIEEALDRSKSNQV